MDIGTLVR